MTTQVPPEAEVAAAGAIFDLISNGLVTKFDLPQYASQIAAVALEAAAPLIAASIDDRIRRHSHASGEHPGSGKTYLCVDADLLRAES